MLMGIQRSMILILLKMDLLEGSGFIWLGKRSTFTVGGVSDIYHYNSWWSNARLPFEALLEPGHI